MRRLAFFVATALTLAVPLHAQEDGELRWSPEKSMEFRVVQQTAVSPDGSLVAFVVRVPVMEGEKSEYLSHIWLARPDGSSGSDPIASRCGATTGPPGATRPPRAMSWLGSWPAIAMASGWARHFQPSNCASSCLYTGLVSSSNAPGRCR